MAHKLYENFVLENKLEDLLTTHISLNQFATADNSLQGQPGMKKKIHQYTATGDVEDLAMGDGNTKDIEVSFTEKEYTVGTTQGRFSYYDEQEMTDPQVVDTGLYGLSTQMTNDLTKKIIKEFDKGTLTFNAADAYGGLTFEAVVDAIATFPGELTDQEGLFLLINRQDLSYLRKSCKDELKYVEDYIRTGYIGTLCGVPIYVSDAVAKGKAYLATRAAVTIFTKKGSETEQQRDPNTRKNTVYARKVMLVALTDATKLVVITTAREKAAQ